MSHACDNQCTCDFAQWFGPAEPEPDPQAENMEIENHRYLPEAFFVLPLTSGRIAILTPRRDLYQVVSSWEEAKRVGPKAGLVSRPEAKATSLGDLGL